MALVRVHELAASRSRGDAGRRLGATGGLGGALDWPDGIHPVQRGGMQAAAQGEPARFNGGPSGYELVVFCEDHYAAFVSGRLPPERVGPESVIEADPSA